MVAKHSGLSQSAVAQEGRIGFETASLVCLTHQTEKGPRTGPATQDPLYPLTGVKSEAFTFRTPS